MAFLGDFELVKRFLHTTAAKSPLVSMMLGRQKLSAEDITTYEDFCRIPVLTKEELSRLHTGMMPPALMYDSSRITKQFISPGPIYNAKGPRYDHYRFHYALRRAGFSRRDTVVNTFSYHMTPAGDMFDEAIERIGAVSVPMGPTDSAKAVQTIQTTGATAFIGTRTFLNNILEEAGGPLTLARAYLIAEKLTTREREAIESASGIDVYQGYGTAEVGLIATECPVKNGMHVEVSNIFVEILDPETRQPVPTGTMGELVVTFLSEATPYVRLSTGDLSVAKEGLCKCGGSFAVITGIFGRADGSVKVRGAFIHGWQLSAFFAARNSHGSLTIAEGEGGRDTIMISTPLLDTEELKGDFKEFFGLTLNGIVVDESVTETTITDTRKNVTES